MPITGFRSLPRDIAEWDRFFISTPVVPSSGSVDGDVIKDGAVSEPKLADDAISSRTIADNAVDDHQLRDSDPCSVIGRAADSSGDPADIALDDNEFLVRRAGVVQGGSIIDADIPSGIARDSEVAAAIAAHEGAGDPHPQYALESDTPKLSADNTYSRSVDAGALQRFENTSAGVNAVTELRLRNNVHEFFFQLYGGNSTQSGWTGGPVGEQLLLGLNDNVSISIGTNGVQRLLIDGAGASVKLSATLVYLDGAVRMNVATTTIAPSAGAAGALPATPAGYATINIGGTDRQIPYY